MTVTVMLEGITVLVAVLTAAAVAEAVIWVVTYLTYRRPAS